MRCPCGRDAELEACCGRFVRGGELPETAEELMRSRYTAYALGEVDYLVATHSPPPEREGIERWAREATFTGLTILATHAGGPRDRSGVVEFEARWTSRGVEQRHRERSRFARVDGRWAYLDGAAPAVRSNAPGRNDPCPCGSGKKFKKCCGE